MGRARRIADRVIGGLTRWGVVPHTYLLSVKGRKTGRLYSTPVTLVERGADKWLVAPYGPVSWVLNARAAGSVTLARRGVSRTYRVRELGPEEAAPVLKEYVNIASATGPYFVAQKNSPEEEFRLEAHRHPVFALTSPNGQ
jgi:deazaflavin-dependent oxidoreductase (nitroreductase family)